MRRVAVGVHVDAAPERARTTFDVLREQTSSEIELIVLLDGLALEAAHELPGDVRRLNSAEQLGRAAWFNRLHATTTADVIVFLENGCRVAAGWLDALLRALDAEPRHGLAGPSTNRSWNEQCVGNGGMTDIAGAREDAVDAARGGCGRTLAPLYSLGDFCYAVRRSVIETIGDADERYGVGPCWEMDYNIRAARAGWQGVWVPGAFVWRDSPTARRMRDDQLTFDRNKRLYQDKFCALRLRGDRATYETHCRGDACEHFAPRTLIEVARRAPTPPSADAVPAVPASLARAPLVSCIMPTRDRPDYAVQAARYFLRQDYPNLELVVVDDGTEDLAPLLPRDPRIRHERVARGLTIGAKRNHGCAVARGDILVHWDDDDWYSPRRVSTQVAAIVAGEADITGLTAGVFFALDRWEFWRISAALHRRLFVHDVHGGTLAMHRRVWQAGARYPDVSLAEDALFLRDAVRRGARLVTIPGDDLFIYLRHATNSWRFECGQHLDPRGWAPVTEPPPLTAADREFYAARSRCAPAMPSDAARATGATLVSCIMPTADRRAFVPRAIEYFLRQDYPNRELIVVDDGSDPVGDLIPADPRIRYLRLATRLTVGAKRNVACEESHGELVLHWDDDDWMSSARISMQAAALRDAPGADVCGLASLYFHELASGRSWRYSYRGGRAWVSGNTLCYRRTAWKRRGFLSVDDGEDTRFVWSAVPGSVAVMSDPSFFVAIIHGRNTSAKRTTDASWEAIDPTVIRTLLGDDAAFYEADDGTRAGVDAAAAARMQAFPVSRPAVYPGPPMKVAAAMPETTYGRPSTPRRG